jgi:ribosomal protein L37AE/L43A
MVMNIWECALCGAAYSNAAKHQRFHDELDAWIQLIEQELDAKIRRSLHERSFAG